MREQMVKSVKDKLLAGVERAKRGGASAAKITFGHSEAISSSFESGRLKGAASTETYSFTIDIVKNGRRSGSSGNRLERLDDMIDRALEFSKTGSAAHFTEFPAPQKTVKLKYHSQSVLGITRDKMIEDCGKIVDALKQVDAKLHISAGASRTEHESLLVTSGGVCNETAATGWSLGASVQRTEGNDILMSGYGRGWGEVNEYYDINAVIDRIKWELKYAEKTVEAPNGKVKAFFTPDSIWMLTSPIISAVSGRRVVKGDSPLKGRIGEEIISPAMTITDNPHVDYSHGAQDMDSSGIPTRKQTIVDKGVLKTFLYDLDTAGLAGAQPTGNDGCSPYYVNLNRGKRPSQEMLKSIKDGVYILDALGYGQGNIMNGDISCNIGLGYRIKNGEIVGRIKDTMMAGNAYELCKNIELSSDSDYLGIMPYAVVDGLNVTTRQ